jgi:hypothetical protein
MEILVWVLIIKELSLLLGCFGLLARSAMGTCGLRVIKKPEPQVSQDLCK